MAAQSLVHRIDVSQRGRIHHHVVPRQVCSIVRGQPFQSEIGGEPGRVLEIVQRSHAFDNVWREKCWPREDDALSFVFNLTRNYTVVLSCFGNTMSDLPSSYKAPGSFEQTFYDPAVPFGPGKRAFVFWFA